MVWDSDKRRLLEAALEEVKSASKSRIDAVAKIAIKFHKYYKEVFKTVERYLKKTHKSVVFMYIVDAVLKRGDAKLTPEKNPYPKRLEKSLVMGDLFHLITINSKEQEKVFRVLRMWVKREDWFSKEMRDWLHSVLIEQDDVYRDENPAQETPQAVTSEISSPSLRYNETPAELDADAQFAQTYEQYVYPDEQDITTASNDHDSKYVDPNDPVTGFDYGDEDYAFEEEEEFPEVASNTEASNQQQYDKFPGLVIVEDGGIPVGVDNMLLAASTTISIDNQDMDLNLDSIKSAFSSYGEDVLITSIEEGKRFVIKFQRRRDAEDAMEDIKEVDNCLIISTWENPGIGTQFDPSTGCLHVSSSEANSLTTERVMYLTRSSALESLSPLKRPLHAPTAVPSTSLGKSILKRARYY